MAPLRDDPEAVPTRVGRTDPPSFMFETLRTRAFAGVDETGRAPKVVLLVAPVGYGKTVQMATRLADLRRSGRQCLWFALDDRDTTVDGLVAELFRLIEGSASATHPTQDLFRGQPPLQSRIDDLVASLDARPLPLTIFIDNLNCCDDSGLGSLLDRLVFGTQDFVHLVLSSNRELPLDVSRAQLQGLLRLVGAAELALTVSEVGKMLTADLCRRIGAQGVEQIARETEGWPAAVRMAQIVLAGSARPRDALELFSGSDEALAHLLNRQVFSGLPGDVREFLMCISQLRTFSVELCIHVTGSDRAAEHLAYLIQRNVFVIPLDRNRHGYRLHGLFRDFVRHEAEGALELVRRQEVLARAAAWCEQHDAWREAVDYALAAGVVATTCRILERIAAMFVRDRGQVLQFVEWVETLHRQGREAGPEAEYWFAWALAFRRRYDYARQQIALLARRMEAEPGDARGAEHHDLRRRIDMLTASIDSLADHREDAHRGASRWLQPVGGGIDDPFNVAAAHCIESSYFSNAHRFVDSRQALRGARAAAFQADSVHVDGWVSAYAAMISIHEGEYASAYPELVDSLTRARRALGDDAGICGTMAMVGACCAVEMGLQEEAWQLISAGLRTSRTHGFLEAAGFGLEAAIRVWQGQADERIALATLRDIADAYPPRLSTMLSCYLIQRLVNLGRLEEAQGEADRIGLAPIPGSATDERALGGFARLDALVAFTRITLLVGSGQYRAAEALIAANVRDPKLLHCASWQVNFALSSAEIAVRTSRQPAAVRLIARAVSLAASRNIVRPFQDKAEILATVVTGTRANAWGFANNDERRFFIERCRGLDFEDGALGERIASLQDEQSVPASALTKRELELLQYVDAGLSNQQIADRGGVTLTTVKWHFQNVFAKLDVTNRSAALSRARALRLLPR